jgi:hypothetical protein
MKLTMIAILILLLTNCTKWEASPPSFSCNLQIKDTIKGAMQKGKIFQLPNCPSTTNICWTDTDTGYANLGFRQEIAVLVNDAMTSAYVFLPLNEDTYVTGYALKWTGFNQNKSVTISAWRDPK